MVVRVRAHTCARPEVYFILFYLRKDPRKSSNLKFGNYRSPFSVFCKPIRKHIASLITIKESIYQITSISFDIFY